MANMRLVKLKNRPSKGVFVFEYMQEQIERLRGQGKERTVETYQSALNSFMKFRDGIDLCFDEMDADLMEHYETEMRSTHHLSRNTTSFYMRILRCVYRKAVGEGLALPADPFENVYTGVDKTSKRAATLTDIKHIKQLDLSDHKSLEFARDIFLFSFYMRGMSFIDLAYLRKKDLNSGFVSYSRRKTGKKLIIRWEKQMQEIIDRYGDSETQYLLPIIEREDGTEHRQYRNKMLLVNRKLKKIAARAGLTTPLTMYVARHSWASIAKTKNISIGIISEAMGHDSETTTQIYLSSIQTNQIDNANRNMLFMLGASQKVVLFTSTQPGEGKSFIAGNTAVSLAYMGKKVVIVGLDIRKPGLNKVFNLSHRTEGITNYLADPEHTNLFDMIQHSDVSPNLDILPSGPIPPNPTELMARTVLEDAIEKLKERYDYIILDTAPIAIVTDTAIASRVADMCVYVCRADVTPKLGYQYINVLRDQKKFDKLATVINSIDLNSRKSGYGYGHKYGYGYGHKYGYGYGYGMKK